MRAYGERRADESALQVDESVDRRARQRRRRAVARARERRARAVALRAGGFSVAQVATKLAVPRAVIAALLTEPAAGGR